MGGSKKLEEEKAHPYITALRACSPDPPKDPPLILLRSSRGAFGEDLGTGKYGSLYNSPRRGYSNVVHWVCFHRRFRGGGRWVLVGVVLIRFGLREGWT